MALQAALLCAIALLPCGLCTNTVPGQPCVAAAAEGALLPGSRLDQPRSAQAPEAAGGTADCAPVLHQSYQVHYVPRCK